MSNDFRDLKSNIENKNKENQNKKDKNLDILKDKLKNTDYKQKINDLDIESKAKFALEKTKEGLEKTKEVYEQATKRVSTGLLNKVINEAYVMNPPQSVKNKRLRILYTTQVGVQPPTFVLFANNSSLMKDHYKRYIENKLRVAFGFFGTPIRISLRERSNKDKK